MKTKLIFAAVLALAPCAFLSSCGPVASSADAPDPLAGLGSAGGLHHMELHAQNLRLIAGNPVDRQA